MGEALGPHETVGTLAAFVERTRMSLMEAGETDLADRVHIVIWRDGGVSLRFDEISRGGVGHDTVEKALSIDPEFQAGPRRNASPEGGTDA